jgi:hypothetical protein
MQWWMRRSRQMNENVGRVGPETKHVRRLAEFLMNAFAQLYRECASSRKNADLKKSTLRR